MDREQTGGGGGRYHTSVISASSGRGGRAGTLDLSDHLVFPCIHAGPSHVSSLMLWSHCFVQLTNWEDSQLPEVSD